MEQKKVLFVATIASHIKGFHEPYLKLFKEKGYKTYVAANWNLKKTDKINYCDKICELSIQRSPYSLKNIKAIRQLKKIIEKEQFDIIHCHTPMGSVVTRLAAKKARKKYGTRVIYTAHGFHFYKGAPKKNWLLFYPIEKYLSKYTDDIITINKEDYALASKKFKTKVHYIPGVGINIEKFDIKMINNDKEKLRKSLGLEKNDFILTCVARLDKNKNQGFLINVMERLVKEYQNIHLLLAGRDELNGYYQAIVNNKKLEKKIHFLGNVDDVPKLLSITNIILSASQREGLPVNVMEAFASGLPVVALECRGMKDLIQNEKNGYIIENNDDSEKKFCESISYLYNNPDVITEIKKNNLKCIKEFEINKLIKTYEQVYFK